MERFRQMNAELERAAQMKPGENCTGEDIVKLRASLEAEVALLENDIGIEDGGIEGDGQARCSQRQRQRAEARQVHARAPRALCRDPRAYRRRPALDRLGAIGLC